MATKKTASKAAPKKKDTLIKIAETIGEVAGHISVTKDQWADKASHAVDAIKEGVQNLTGKGTKKSSSKKSAPKKVAAKKATPRKAAAKKAAPKKAAKPGGALLHKALKKKKSAGKTANKSSAKKAAGKK